MISGLVVALEIDFEIIHDFLVFAPINFTEELVKQYMAVVGERPLWVASSRSLLYHLGGCLRPEADLRHKRKPRHEGGASAIDKGR